MSNRSIHSIGRQPFCINFTLCHWKVFISPQKSHWQKNNDQKSHWWDFSKNSTRNVDSVIFYCWKSHWWLQDGIVLNAINWFSVIVMKKLFLKSDFFFVFVSDITWNFKSPLFLTEVIEKFKSPLFVTDFPQNSISPLVST